jgi:hypothetical protein
MRPESKRNRSDQFTPKWRHFHPQATLIMRNPFADDIVFRVADEHNIPYDYRLPGNKICELPGGAVATLGLKAVIDRMIGDEGKDLVRIWDPATRKRYEERVIVKVREAPQTVGGERGGEVNLGITEDELAEREETPRIEAEEQEFPGARRQAERAAEAAQENGKAIPTAPAGKTTKSTVSMRGGGKQRDPELAAVAGASLGGGTQLIEE